VKEEVLEDVSAFPITNELALGVNEATVRDVEPEEELPVDVARPCVFAPWSS